MPFGPNPLVRNGLHDGDPPCLPDVPMRRPDSPPASSPVVQAVIGLASAVPDTDRLPPLPPRSRPRLKGQTKEACGRMEQTERPAVRRQKATLTLVLATFSRAAAVLRPVAAAAGRIVILAVATRLLRIRLAVAAKDGLTRVGLGLGARDVLVQL